MSENLITRGGEKVFAKKMKRQKVFQVAAAVKFFLLLIFLSKADFFCPSVSPGNGSDPDGLLVQLSNLVDICHNGNSFSTPVLLLSQADSLSLL